MEKVLEKYIKELKGKFTTLDEVAEFIVHHLKCNVAKISELKTDDVVDAIWSWCLTKYNISKGE